MRASRSAGVSTTRGSHVRDELRALERVLVRLRVVPVRVQRLGAVRERVHRRADGLRPRQAERQPDVVDDAGGCARRRRRRASAAAGRARRSTASTPRPSTSSGPRRAARAPPPRSPCRGRSRCRRRRRRRRRARDRPPPRCAPTAPRSSGRPARTAARAVPARARDEERRLVHAELVEHLREQRDVAPADDHASRSRAKSTNACATRVSARPVERTSEISRAGLEPLRRARSRACRRRGRRRSPRAR